EMNQGDVRVARQLKELLFAAVVKVVEVAGDKQGTARLGQTAGIGEHFFQAQHLPLGNGGLQLAVEGQQLLQQFQHRVLAAARAYVALGFVAKDQAANPVAVAQCGPGQLRADV